jgi:hypothetical protein
VSSAIDIIKGPVRERGQRKRRRFLMAREGSAALLDPIVAELLETELGPRPRVRSECKDGPRPCPWVGCRYHLYLDTYTTGDPENPTPGLIIHHPELDPLELPETCLLDLAEHGPFTLAQIGELFDLSRERIRQIESSALRKLSRCADVRDPEAIRRLLESV